jgi:hypothetical protein
MHHVQRQLVVTLVSTIALGTLLAATRAVAQDGPIIPGLEDVPAVTYPQGTVESQRSLTQEPPRRPLTQSRPDPFGEGGASDRRVIVPRQRGEEPGVSGRGAQPTPDAARQALDRYRQLTPQQRALQQQQQLQMQQQQRATGGYRNQSPPTMRTSDPTWNTPQQDNARRGNPGLQAVGPDPRAMQRGGAAQPRPNPMTRDPRAASQTLQQRGPNQPQTLRAQGAPGKARSTTAPQVNPSTRGAQSWRPQQAPPQRSGAKAWNAPQR